MRRQPYNVWSGGFSSHSKPCSEGLSYSDDDGSRRAPQFVLDKLTVAESWWSGPVNKFLSATVSLSCTNCGARRHPSSSLYERPSDQGLEWELKPPLQTLRGWRRNVQACLSWSNDRLSAEIAATAIRLLSTMIQQTQRWAPELPYSSRTGPEAARPWPTLL